MGFDSAEWQHILCEIFVTLQQALRLYKNNLLVALVPLNKFRDADTDRRGGVVAALLLNLSDIGISGGHVAGLEWQELHLRGYAQCLPEDADHIQQALGSVIADVKEFVRLKFVREEGSDDALDDVVHKGEVALHFPVVEDGDRFPLDHGLGEQPHGHVRAAPGTVNRKESQTDGLQSIQVRVGVRHQFIGFLGRRIQTDRMINGITLAEGEFCVSSIDAGTGGIDQTWRLGMAASFQNAQESLQIRLLIDKRMGQGIPDAGLGCQMTDTVERLAPEESGELFVVAQIGLHSCITHPFLQDRVAVPLQSGVVVIVEIVQPDNRMAKIEQLVAQMKPDKTSSSCDEDVHGEWSSGEW